MWYIHLGKIYKDDTQMINHIKEWWLCHDTSCKEKIASMWYKRRAVSAQYVANSRPAISVVCGTQCYPFSTSLKIICISLLEEKL